MAFGLKETSRTKGNPAKLFLFKGTDPTLESMMRSVTIGPGATEFGYGTTRVNGEDIPVVLISDWNAAPLTDGALYVVSAGALNGPPTSAELVGRTVIEVPFPLNIGKFYAYDHVADVAWQRSFIAGVPDSGWVSSTYVSTMQPAYYKGPPRNYYAEDVVTDFAASLEDLLATAPHLKHVSLVVAWHGTDLRCGTCEVRPRVEQSVTDTVPYNWQVGDMTRSTAQLSTQISGKSALGGAPSDRSIYEAIVALKAKGLMVTVHPIMLMDIGSGNALPNPYGGTGQPTYPWRGKITCHPAPGESGTVDGSGTAASQVEAFFGTAATGDFSWNTGQKRVNYGGSAEWKYRRFILHMATIAKAADADDFLIGSDLTGVTRVRGAAGAYPAVDRLKTLAADVRSILGVSPKISYAANWTEFHSHQIDGDLHFHLDPLWSDVNINYVGINNFMPTSDWRDGYAHLDWSAGYTSIHDPFYLKANIEGGEYFAWQYATPIARTNQVRTPIVDSVYNEPWVYRLKDLRGWWSNRHYDRVGGVRQPAASAWVPESKLIVFTQLGCAAVEKGPNRPSVSVDAKSSESATPYFSNGKPDAAVMRVYLESMLDYWREGGPNNDGMINGDKISVWTWDARPYPVFPNRSDLFPDASNWATGHWLTGRVSSGRAFEHGEFGPYAYTDAEAPITRAGIVYQPWPITHSDIATTGTLDKSDITVSMAVGSGLEDEFLGYPPSQVINLTIFQGHMDDVPSLVDFPAQWLGRINAPEFSDNEVSFNCIPVSTSIQRPGLRRNYQLGCPHVLYGSQCRASKTAATVTRAVAAIVRNRVTLTVALGAIGITPSNYHGGLLEWVAPNGQRHIRTIVKVSPDGLDVSIRGTLRGLEVGDSMTVTLGCARNMTDCRLLHDNILNFGGQPFIPLENPLSQKNQFF